MADPGWSDHTDERHAWMFERVAASLQLEPEAPARGIEHSHLAQISHFFRGDAPRKLLWYLQPIRTATMPASATLRGGEGTSAAGADASGAIDDHDTSRRGGLRGVGGARSRGRSNRNTERGTTAAKHAGVLKFVVTSGEDVPLHGKCVYFLRTAPDGTDVTVDNINTSIVTGVVDGSDLLRSLQETLKFVMLPALKASPRWGDLERTDEDVEAFLEDVDRFVVMLEEVMGSLRSAVTLRMPEGRLHVENKPAAIAQAATDPDLVATCEGYVEEWCKQIEAVLTESEVVRKENDDIGPNAELEHWKSRMAKFNSITDQLKTLNVKIVVGIVAAAKSKKMEIWRALDTRITDAANEAKDNVKYLYTLERFAEPLYKSDPVQMVDAIPGLINAIKMMHSIARYYNTSERMTALFVKITNQMITCCKNYINADGDIWEQNRLTLIEKFAACQRLNDAYQDTFHRTRARLKSTPKDKQFDFSEMYIFGKFEIFCKRIKKLKDMFTIIEQFSSLRQSSIEDMDAIVDRFSGILAEMRNKHYDLLDLDTDAFEDDYVLFYENIINLERLLLVFINTSFEPVTSTARALQLLRQFKSVLLRKNLRKELENKYLLIFANYQRELDVIEKKFAVFEKRAQRDIPPPLPRDTPLYAGAIAWARQLFRRIEEPMNLFSEHGDILETEESAKVVNVYNRLTIQIHRLQRWYHKQWCESTELIQDSVHATLLVRHPTKLNRLFVNFDKEIVEIIREAKSMQRMGLAIPPIATSLCVQEERYKNNYNALTFMLAEYERVTEKITRNLARKSSSNNLKLLFTPHVDAIKARLEPGLVTLKWTSLNIEPYVEGVHEALAELEELVDKANDIIECRVLKAVGHIETTLMVDLPRDETWTIASFAARTEEQCLEAAAFIDSKSVMAETAVNDLIGLITASYSPAEMGKLTDPIDRVTAEFKNITFNAIVAACRRSMEAVRSRVGVSLEAGGSVLAGVTFAGDTIGGGGGSGGPSGAGGGSSGNLLRGVGGGRSSAALGPDGDEIALGGMASEDYSLELHSRDGEGYFDVIRKKKDPLPTIYANDPPGASSGPPPLPLFRVELELQIPHVVMEPRMEDIQACLNHVGDAIENATKHIYGWDQDRTSGNTANLKNYFLEVSTKPEIAKLHRDLSTGINQLKGFVDTYLATFTMFDGLWRLSKQEAFEVFLQTEPTLHDYEGELRRYHKLEQDIASIPDIYSIGALAFDARPLKEALLIETGQWKQFYGVNLKSKSQKEMRFVLEFVDETVQRLGREVKDLDDIKAVMDVLALVREEEATIEMKIVPIENTYNTLNKYQIRYSKEEADGADRLTYSWESLKKEAAAKQDQLIALQPAFRRELLEHLAEFESDLHDFKRLYDAEGPRVEGISPRTALERLTAFTAMCAERQRKAETYNGGEVLFGLPKTNYDDLNSITEDLRKLDKLYGLYSEVIVVVGGYKELLWSDLNLDEIKAQVKTFQDRMRRLKKMKTWDAYIELKKTIDDIDRKIPLLEQLSSRAVQDRHWDSITEVTGHTFNRDPDAFKLRHILEAPLLQFEDQVYDICLSATNEAGIEQGLRAIQMDWNDANFEFKDFHGRGELVLDFDRTQEIMVMIEEALMKLHSLANSRYNKYFEAEIMLWTQKLLTCNREIEAWVSVQNLWIYLEAVFIGGDISRAMPVQAKEFQIIDKSWQKIMAAVHDNPNVVAFAYSDETLHNMLPHLQAKLEDCRSALGSYLEQKQRAFPRFYFLSPGSLLEVLGQCNSNTHSIKDHLHTVFANVKDVRFSQTDYDTIVGLISNEDEYVPLVRPMECEGNVEVWLAKLTEAMRQTMRRILHRGYGMFPQPEVKDALEGFIHEQQAQVSLVALQLWWTRECESALMNAQTNPQAIKEADTKSKKIFRRLLKLTRSFLDDVERVNVETLVTVHLHQFLVFRRLQSQGVSRPDHSEWLKQARFYLKTGDDIQIHITDVEFRYSYEYLGVSDRLVITPLTDQCYITLAQALGMSLGGAPAGPAGTGKTETVKDMGKALGKYVIIQNCAPEMRYYQLEKIFKGLAMSGCWGDFDEFNRITLPVLSVAAQQISRIFQAKKDRKKKFLYTDGTLVSIDWSCGIFITMNPTYTGRQELPENLKLQFRTVAMMIPDREKIMQVKLAAAGFDEFMTLAEKFRWLYQMCEEQLSKQHHYDFGLRNILSVLRTCGAVKRTNTGEDEAQLLQRVARDMNLSKLVNDDYRLFLELLDDLFPNAEQDRKSAVEQALAANIGRVCAQRGLVDHPAWHRKVVQLYETSLVRHGIIILGPSGAGKTECIRTLVAALNLEAQDAKDNPPAPDPNNPNAGPPAVPPTYREFRMNPKAMHPDKFLGTADKNTGEWDDGVFSALWKKFYKVLSKKKHDRIWLTMDGPIDSLWIESLNTVLDDTKKLTLPNNDRLDMHKNFKLLFEVDSVLKASPATVSRNGMIYMSDEALGWKPVLLAWIGGRSESERNVLLPLFEAVWDRLTSQVKEHLVERMEVPMINYIQTCVDLLEGLLPPRPAAPSPQAGGHGSSKRSRRSANASTSAGFGGGVSSHGARPGVEASEFFLNHCFIFAVTWSLGGLLDAQTRRLFHNLLEDIEFLDLPHAREDETVFDFLVDTRGELTQSADLGEWVSWRAMVPSYTFQPEGKVESFYNVIIPTVSMVRTKYLVSSVAEQTKNVLLTGESGTAKTVTLLSYLDDLPREDFVYTRFNFSSATTPGLFQETIEGSVDRRHNFYIPPDGKKMNVFIDDISMPQNNEHGDQPTNEIVRQLIEEHGFYNLEKTGEFKQVLDLQFLAAMFQPGGGRNDIPDRLKRHFSVFNVSLPPPAEINYIYSTMITGFFNEARGFARDVVARAAEIAPLMQRIWEWTKENMLPTPENFHYMYNLRDLSRITEGLLLAEADVVTNAKLLFQLFKHEADRVLCDKLSLKRHKNDYSVALENILTEALGAPVAAELMEPVYFVDFLRDEPDDEDIDDDAPDDIFDKPKIYEPIKSIKGLRSRIQMFLNEYNAERGQYLDLVLFGDCIAHVVRVSRLIARPRGNALLVGVGGSGKKSVARLASHIAGYPFVKLSMARSYNTASFLEDLQRIYKDAGSKDGGPLTFCFADGDIKEEGFLEYINSFLTSGAVTSIMPKEDMETIVMDLRPLLREEQPNTDGKSENVTKFFVDRVRRNVHLVLSFSAVGEKFRNRALKFPGLISGCGIDWFEQWPKDALTAVAERFVGDPEVDIVSTPKVRISLIQYMSNAHYAVERKAKTYYETLRRRAFVTPKSYITFIQSYIGLYAAKKAEVDAEADRMRMGLQKLEDAGRDVSNMSKLLAAQNRQLKASQDVMDEMMVRIVKSSEEAARETERVEKIKDEVEAQAEIARGAADQARLELEKAMPALLEAQEALDVIEPRHINELKQGNNPVHFTQRVLECVRIMRYLPLVKVAIDEGAGKIKTSWSMSVVMMKKGDFLSSLGDGFPLESLNGEMIDLLEPFYGDEEFTADRAESINFALLGLFKWVNAMMKYYREATNVEPMKRNEKKAMYRLELAEAKLREAEAVLEEKDAVRRTIQAEHDGAARKKEALEAEAAETEGKINTARELITELAGEKERWTEKSLGFQDDIRRLIGDAAVATAFVSYAGPFSQEYRADLVETWLEDLTRLDIPSTANLDVVSLLADDNRVSRWHLESLPTDEQSVQNGVIVHNSASLWARFPLLIDPQGQGNAWIREHEESRKSLMEFATLTQADITEVVKNCVSSGRPLLIEDVQEELIPSLDNVLEKGVKAGSRIICKVGDETVDFHPDFRLYLTTKLANPRFTPEILAKVAVVDFTVTRRGLEDQLLGRVIGEEKAQLEVTRMELLKAVSDCKRKIRQMEERLLDKLSSVGGSLVDDPTVMEVLTTTKMTALDARQKLKASEDTEAKIADAREKYRGVATRGSILYFLVMEMAEVNPMYQTSLQQFTGVFYEAIRDADQHTVPDERRKNIINKLTDYIFAYVTQGLLEDHKFLFVLQMGLKIDLAAGRISPEAYNVLIKGRKAVLEDDETVMSGRGAALSGLAGRGQRGAAQQVKEMLTADALAHLKALSHVEGFYDILNQIEANFGAWQAWYNLPEPEEGAIPNDYEKRLSDNLFERMLLIRCIAPDRFYFAAQDYIEQHPALGVAYTKPPVGDFLASYEQSKPSTPIICLLSLGADPSENIKAAAKSLRMPPPRDWSMGEGQKEGAQQILAECMESGEWMLLQNCHLGLDFMEELSTLMPAAAEAGEIHPEFRLWLTTAPVDDFPISLLHISLKLTNDPPQGLQAGLIKTFNNVWKDKIDAVEERDEWRPLMFSICFMHSVVQERRKFKALGWNTQYEFNQSDLVASLAFLQKHLDELDTGEEPDWEMIRYMICAVHYGGRVTDKVDELLMKALGEHFLKPEVVDLNNPYQLAPGYLMPDATNEDGYKQYIAALEPVDLPDVFHLHRNADITYRSRQAEETLQTILLSLPAEELAGDGESPEIRAKKIALKKLPQIPPPFPMSEVRETLQEMDPLSIFLLQEIQRIQVVSELVLEMLQTLIDAVNGIKAMSDEISHVIRALNLGIVPAKWTAVSWEAASLEEWITSFRARHTQYQNWLNHRPTHFDIGLMFNAQGFLTAVLQEYGRNQTPRLSLNRVSADTKVCKTAQDENKKLGRGEGVFVTGLILEGASWRNSKLNELQQKDREINFPTLWFGGIEKRSEDLSQYQCPIYKSRDRTEANKIIKIALPSGSRLPDHWVKRGVALLALGRLDDFEDRDGDAGPSRNGGRGSS